MALTVTEVGRRRPVGDVFERVFDITFDASYATGGLALLPATLGFAEVINAIGDGGAGYDAYFDRPTNKLKAFASGGVEAANATNLAAVTQRVVFRGR